VAEVKQTQKKRKSNRGRILVIDVYNKLRWHKTGKFDKEGNPVVETIIRLDSEEKRVEGILKIYRYVYAYVVDKDIVKELGHKRE